MINEAITATAIATADLVLKGVEALEAIHGPLPKLRHLLHAAQAEAERVMGMEAGALVPTPDGGIPKNPSS